MTRLDKSPAEVCGLKWRAALVGPSRRHLIFDINHQEDFPR